MKIYVKANSEKPFLDKITTEWVDIDNGIQFIVNSDDGEVLFEEVFDYADVDSDAIYDSALTMALMALQQKYELSDEVIFELSPSQPAVSDAKDYINRKYSEFEGEI